MLRLTDQNLRRSLGGKGVQRVLMSGANLDRKSELVMIDDGVKLNLSEVDLLLHFFSK